MGIKEAKEVVRSGKAFYEEALKNAKAEGTRKILQTMKLGSNVFEVYEEFLSEERISDIPELLKPFGALLNKELERNIEEDEVSEADLGTLVELLSTFGGPEDVSLLTENTILNTKQAFDDYKKQTIVNFTKHIGEGFEGLNLFFKEGVELDLGFAFNKDTFAPLVSEGLKGEEIAEFVEGMKDILVQFEDGVSVGEFAELVGFIFAAIEDDFETLQVAIKRALDTFVRGIVVGSEQITVKSEIKLRKMFSGLVDSIKEEFSIQSAREENIAKYRAVFVELLESIVGSEGSIDIVAIAAEYKQALNQMIKDLKNVRVAGSGEGTSVRKGDLKTVATGATNRANKVANDFVVLPGVGQGLASEVANLVDAEGVAIDPEEFAPRPEATGSLNLSPEVGGFEFAPPGGHLSPEAGGFEFAPPGGLPEDELIFTGSLGI